jgi:hypothetical protein
MIDRHPRSTRKRRGVWPLPVRASAATMVIASAGIAWGLGGQPTACVHLCPDLGDPCVVQSGVTVVPGSVIDCGAREVKVTGGDLTVSDGRFALKARRVTVEGRVIRATCGQHVGRHGFTLDVTDAVTVGNNARLAAACDTGGGEIVVKAGGGVSIAGLGIDARGTSRTGGGGTVRIEAGGPVSVTSEIKAQTTADSGDGASGGAVEISGSSLTVTAQVNSGGYRTTSGQGVELRAAGDIMTDALILATTGQGDGGQIRMRAGGTIDVRKPLRVTGFGADSDGGVIELDGGALLVDGDLLADGGGGGGRVDLAARGRIDVGTRPSGGILLGASVNSQNVGQGGEVSLRSEGHDVTLGSHANVRVTDNGGGGTGGIVTIEGVAVTLASGSQVIADGGLDLGGVVQIEARGPLVLAGTMRAVDGRLEFTHRCTATPCEVPPVIGGGVAAGYELLPDDELPAACGDGIRRDPTESCDGDDLGDETCASRGHSGGTLACNDTCSGFDLTGCTN